MRISRGDWTSVSYALPNLAVCCWDVQVVYTNLPSAGRLPYRGAAVKTQSSEVAGLRSGAS